MSNRVLPRYAENDWSVDQDVGNTKAEAVKKDGGKSYFDQLRNEAMLPKDSLTSPRKSYFSSAGLHGLGGDLTEMHDCMIISLHISALAMVRMDHLAFGTLLLIGILACTKTFGGPRDTRTLQCTPPRCLIFFLVDTAKIDTRLTSSSAPTGFGLDECRRRPVLLIFCQPQPATQHQEQHCGRFNRQRSVWQSHTSTLHCLLSYTQP